MIKKTNFYVLTGAPGTGKSTILSELSLQYVTVNEPAREVIAKQRSMNGTGVWEKDRGLFIKLLQEQSVSHFINTLDEGTVFFDRGVPDCIAYAGYGNVNVESFVSTSKEYRYNEKVFLFEPWEGIYKNDDERTMSYSEALRFHERIVDAYEKLGYTLIKVPNVSVRERVDFILQTIQLT